MKRSVAFIIYLCLVCGQAASPTSAATIYLRNGRVIEAEISYCDKEETFVTVSEGVEIPHSNDTIARIEPPRRNSASTGCSRFPDENLA